MHDFHINFLKIIIKSKNWFDCFSSPKTGFDLAAVISATVVFTGQGQISKVIQSYSRVVRCHQNL